MERIGVLVVNPEDRCGKYTVLKNALGYIYLQKEVNKQFYFNSSMTAFLGFVKKGKGDVTFIEEECFEGNV
jgi:hypothetical protein